MTRAYALGRAATTCLLFVGAAGFGCRPRADLCGDPVAVARAFLERFEGGDPAGALELTTRATRDDLRRRADEASRRLRRKVEPDELLVPERSVLARPEWLALRSVLDDEAWVDVRPPGDAAAAEGPWSAQRLVREGGCWKVDLFHPVERLAPTGVGAAAPVE